MSDEKIFAYLRTLRNYLRTPKARHDLKDFARAIIMILITSAIVWRCLI